VVANGRMFGLLTFVRVELIVGAPSLVTRIGGAGAAEPVFGTDIVLSRG